MSASSIAIGALLALAVGVSLLGALGVLVMRDPYERLHYVAPLATIAPFAILVALLVAESVGQAAVKTALTAVMLFGANAVVTHATARAIRIRRQGAWRVERGEREGRRAAASGR